MKHLEVGDRLDLYQGKTKRYRAITANRPFIATIKQWLRCHPDPVSAAPLFISARTGKALTVSVVNRMVKGWCTQQGLRGNYGSHSMRTTWGYHQLRRSGASIPILMEAYGHSSQRQTLDYLCVEAAEINALYTGLEL